MKSKTYGIILAAGASKRMNLKEKKQFILLKNKPVLYYSIEKFLKNKNIDVVVLVINSNDKNNKYILSLAKKYNNLINSFKLCIITGGNERYDSVYNSLSFINNCYGISKNDRVLLHDSARPNINEKDINKLIDLIDKYKSITLGYRLSDSIKLIKNSSLDIKTINKSVNRNDYCLISTPQGFNLKLLYDSYIKFMKSNNKKVFTDDTQIIEKFSKNKSYILESSKSNIKITTKEDLNIINKFI